MKRIFFWFAAIIIAFPLSLQAKMYQWIDAQGVTHYSQFPPPKSNDVVQVAPIRGDHIKLTKATTPVDQPLADTNTIETKAVSAPVVTRSQKEEVCRVAKKTKQTIDSHGRVRILSESGEYRVLTEKEKQKALADSKVYIQKFCS